MFASSVTTEGERRSVVAIISFTIVALLLLISGPVLLFDTWETRGHFGAALGGASAVFAAVAFVVIALTLVLQRQQLELQQRELSFLQAQQRVDAILNLIRLLERRYSADELRHRDLGLYIERLHRDLEEQLRDGLSESGASEGSERCT